MSDRRIYLDYAASSPVDPEVIRAMEPYWSDIYANPNARHLEGRKAHEALEDARKKVADFAGARAHDVVFTSGGTEANIRAIQGTLDAYRRAHPEGGHIITTAIEHPSVLDFCRSYESRGFRLTVLSVDDGGRVSSEECAKMIASDTAFVSIMFANNEMGALQPVYACASAVRESRTKNGASFPLFHTDASQGPLFFDIIETTALADLITLDAQKLYGPKGIGALINKKKELFTAKTGGSQEYGLRPGTQNVPGAVGFASACERVKERREEDVRRTSALQSVLIEGLLTLPGVVLNGSRSERLPNNVNVSLEGIEGEYTVAKLDMLGIAASTRSACIGDSFEGSYVIAAIDQNRANTSVRFTLGRDTTKSDIQRVIDAIAEVITIGRGS